MSLAETSMHLVTPDATVYPFGQGTHFVPPRSEYVPTVHFSHCAEAVLICPSGHSTHAVDNEFEDEFASHGEHAVFEAWSEKKPAAHGEQAAFHSFCEKSPGPHIKHEFCDFGESAQPGPHATQSGFMFPPVFLKPSGHFFIWHSTACIHIITTTSISYGNFMFVFYT